MNSTRTSVVAVFDIGKTNKKFLLFNKNYEVVYERSAQFKEILDDDGEPCEDLEQLVEWIKCTFTDALTSSQFQIESLNFSTYGASFVHVGKEGKPVTPLYNYLKKFPGDLHKQYYNRFGDQNEMARITASPILGNLNSGLQLYLIKQLKPTQFKQIKVSLHLPQFISSIFTDHYFSEITSIGCHTQLWNFDKIQYHSWVTTEGFDKLFPPIVPSDLTINIKYNNQSISCGIGLHDSSAALIPYLKKFKEPFMLLSTGTWCISLNPFNHSTLTIEELNQDCLCYLSFEGKPVKASRLFSGYEHEQSVKKLAQHFNKSEDYFNTVKYNRNIIIDNRFSYSFKVESYADYESAYHNLISNMIRKQYDSSMLVLKDQPVNRIFVDGGFSKNEVFMNMLAKAFPEQEVYSAEVPQAAALGAAMVINQNNDFIQSAFPLKKYEYPI